VAVTELPSDAPAGLRAALDGAALTGFWREGARAYGRAEGDRFVRWSTDPADRVVLAHEAEVRAVIGVDGALRSPPVLAGGAGWLVELAVPADPVSGAIDAVVGAAEALAPLRLPAIVHTGAGNRLATARNRLRLARSPVARELLAARRMLARSPLPLVTSHGDFHAGNLLMEDGRPWVVDWELAGRRPAGYDLMQLWSTLSAADDRERLMEGAVALVGEPMRPHLLDLRYAVVVRTIASKLVPVMELNADPDGARALMALLPELRPSAAR
jgi:Phosphotransferase enzyme family